MISSGRTVRVIADRRPGPAITRISTLNSSNSTSSEPSGSTPTRSTVPRLPVGTRGRNPRDRVASTRSPR
jgi:hypothetical protein